MRFVFLDNDTRMLFATAYDGDWDAYIDDFVTKIPDYPGHHRLRLGGLARDSQPGGEGLPRRSTRSRPRAGTSPMDLTVAETRRLKRIGKAVDEFLDKIGDDSDTAGSLRTPAPRLPGTPVPQFREKNAMTLIDRLGAALPRAPVTVELDDIQATVLRYRPEPYYGTHVMLHVDDTHRPAASSCDG